MPRELMNLNHLRVFHAVASAGSITAAAHSLEVSQPAVSKQLADLEAPLGVSRGEPAFANLR